MESYEAIIIGAGQGGSPLASTFAAKGKKTALIEKSAIGGTCINTGCTPTKALIASAAAAHNVRHAVKYGVHARNPEVNIQEVMNRKDEIVEMFREGSESSVKDTENLDVIFGTATFSGKKTLEIQLNDGGTQAVSGELIFIDTGSHTMIPPIEGADQVKLYDNTSIMEIEELPKHLMIIGGGYIGLEFGQMFRRFGSDVSIFEHGDRLISMEDEDVSEEIANILQSEGVQIHLGSKVNKVSQENGEIEFSGDFSGQKQSYKGTHLLIATGRAPNTEGLNLDKAGVETDDKGYIKVNDRLETTAEGVYALGDVTGGLQFTHVSYNDYNILKKNLLGSNGQASKTDERITYTVFTDPQIGRAGLNEQMAKERGIAYKVAKLPMEKVARAIETSHTKGFMKALVDEKTDKIIGASIVGMEGGEIAAALQIAMMGNLTYQQIRDGVFPHPTLTESLNNLFMTI
jgi:pyruvate/2-oxoglutarate dehydrogenase complex dihydrolipoamide dehydrogenase (E3) component